MILIDWFLPGYRAGGPIQSASNLIQALGDQYSFSVITTDTDHASESPYPNVQANRWIKRETGEKVYYFSKNNLTYEKLTELLDSERFDFLYINSMYSLPFTIWPLWYYLNKKTSFRIVVAPRGMLQAGAVQIKWFKKRTFLFFMRLTGIQKQITWHATDQQEKKDVARFFGNGLDVRVSSNIPKQQQLPWERVFKEPGKARFIFSSRVSRKKNIEFFLERLHHVTGEVEFDIYGTMEDPVYVQQCKEVAEKLPENIKVRFMGDVPSPDLPKVFKLYHFSVLTTHAENFGHSIFEGMLAAKPVIISDRTPWRGLTAERVGWDLPLENPEAFEQVIQQCIDMDQETYELWSLAAWHYAKDFKEDPELIRTTQSVFS